MTFNEFINTDVQDSRKIYEFYINFLGEFLDKDFPYNQQLKLKGVASKFVDSIDRTTYISSEKREQYLKLIDKNLIDFKQYRKIEHTPIILRFLYPRGKKARYFLLQDSFQDLYSKTLELISEASCSSYYFDDLKINNFYNPDTSNKQKIRELINEAISLIGSDSSLSEKSKKSLIEYLNKALAELDRERVNWTKFLGRIRETIIVLGAIGSIAGGAIPLFNAQQKLEQTTVIIQTTSFNYSYNTLNETFNIQNVPKLGPFKTVLELSENKDNQFVDGNETKGDKNNLAQH